MTRTILALVLVALGVALAVVSGLADVIGLSGSEGAEEGFGWKQIVGVAVGAIAAAIGLLVAVTGGGGRQGKSSGVATPTSVPTEDTSVKEAAAMAREGPDTAAATETNNEATVRRLFEEVWNKGSLDVADQLVLPEVVGHDPALPEEVRGVDGLKGLVSTYRRAFPDLRFTVEDLISSGDKVAYRWRSDGTHQGELQGLAPTGNHGSVTGINIDRFVDGKIAESWTQWDNLGLMQQLGAAPTPGSRGERAGIQVQRLSVQAREARKRLRERWQERREGTSQ